MYGNLIISPPLSTPQGWIDVTYMDLAGTFRLSRGNKGTLFILSKDQPLPDRLLAAIQSGAGDAQVLRLVDKLVQQQEQGTGRDSDSGPRSVPAPARDAAAVSGTWRLVWSQQAESASPLQKWGSAQADSFQVIDAAAGRLENVVSLAGGLVQVRARAACVAADDARTQVDIEGAYVALGPLRVPLPVKGSGFVDWLYLDGALRVTRGSKGSLFVHVREAEEEDEEE